MRARLVLEGACTRTLVVAEDAEGNGSSDGDRVGERVG